MDRDGTKEAGIYSSSEGVSWRSGTSQFHHSLLGGATRVSVAPCTLFSVRRSAVEWLHPIGQILWPARISRYARRRRTALCMFISDSTHSQLYYTSAVSLHVSHAVRPFGLNRAPVWHSAPSSHQQALHSPAQHSCPIPTTLPSHPHNPLNKFNGPH
jgi:hypothetical protein